MVRLYLLILCLSVILFSCKNDTNNNYMEDYFSREEYSPEIIRKHKVVERIETKIHTDPDEPIIVWSNGQDISPNKIKKIEYFDENGLCYLQIRPVYKLVKNLKDKNSLSETEKLFFQDRIEANEPSGYYDSVYNYFDKKNRIVKIREVNRNDLGQIEMDITQNFNYDDMGSLISHCSESPNSQSYCRFSRYYYLKNGNIKSSIDSFSVLINRPPYPNIEYIYTYDSNGRKTSVNNTFYKYNNDGLISLEYEVSGKNKTVIKNYTYDSNKNKIKYEIIEPYLRTIDPKTNLINVINYDTSYQYNKFNDKNLKIETIYKRSTRFKDYDLFKYEYKFR